MGAAERGRLKEPLDEFEDIVVKDFPDLGRTKKVYHRSPTGDAASNPRGVSRFTSAKS